MPRTLADMTEEEANKMSTPQIIRTVDELKALDPDTALTLYTWDATIWEASYFHKCLEDTGYIPDLPAVVVATGEQVRAARKALEEAEEG
ncbi:hypothetical protein PETEYPAB_61 [Corynebacterium phage PeteyPab]|uniref:Uncharacterized protein n=2 Tax=Corynebacterium virus Zion TaxID=2560397 RepID=A0A2H4P9B3_9CAUD|nr:hypothetical protein SEA_POTATOCHIP_62 [Corynebacterium phage PotatoChip]AYR03325.1 hypothetical protein PETEYPAB_61 [Corynebacterium phage PeteyPab]